MTKKEMYKYQESLHPNFEAENANQFLFRHLSKFIRRVLSKHSDKVGHANVFRYLVRFHEIILNEIDKSEQFLLENMKENEEIYLPYQKEKTIKKNGSIHIKSMSTNTKEWSRAYFQDEENKNENSEKKKSSS